MSLSGLSINRIAFLLRLPAQSVLTWIQAFATEHDKKPETAGKTISLQLDEMWHYLKKKRRKLWMDDPSIGLGQNFSCGPGTGPT